MYVSNKKKKFIIRWFLSKLCQGLLVDSVTFSMETSGWSVSP